MILNNSFKILSLHARRTELHENILNIKNICEIYSPQVICFQEIHILTVLKVFSEHYQVVVNFNKQALIAIAAFSANDHFRYNRAKYL